MNKLAVGLVVALVLATGLFTYLDANLEVEDVANVRVVNVAIPTGGVVSLHLVGDDIQDGENTEKS